MYDPSAGAHQGNTWAKMKATPATTRNDTAAKARASPASRRPGATAATPTGHAGGAQDLFSGSPLDGASEATQRQAL